MARRIRGTWMAAALAGVALAGCELAMPVTPVATPRARPATLPAPISVARPTSEKSAALRSYFAQVQTAQTSSGLLRTDGGGQDAPFSADMLARNFEKIAFYNEYDSNFQGRGGQSPLRRWAGPVRMEVVFGASVPPSVRARDSGDIHGYAERLARATGHPIARTTAPKPWTRLRAVCRASAPAAWTRCAICAAIPIAWLPPLPPGRTRIPIPPPLR